MLVFLAVTAWLAVLGAHRWFSWSRRASIGLLLAATLWCWLPSAWLFAVCLEAAYPVVSKPRPPAGGPPEAMVVLSGEVRWHWPAPPEAFPGPSTSIRCRHAAWLHRNGFPLPIVASGGRSETWAAEGEPPATYVMREALIQLGVPESSIVVEDRSQTTRENAVQSAAILRAMGIRRILLVTEAYHMPRAEACFRKLGIEVIPAPCGFRHPQFRYYRWSHWLPSRQAIEWNESQLRELAAMVVYRMRGWI